MKLITRFNNNLPSNQKVNALSARLRPLVGLSICKAEWEEFIEWMRKLIMFANEHYPRTKPLGLRSYGDSITITLDGTDKCMYFAISEVKKTWAETDKTIILCLD